MSGRSSIDEIPPFPDDFDAVVEWFERLSSGLVLLAEYPLSEVDAGVRAFNTRVRSHLEEFSARLERVEPSAGRMREVRLLLRSDHAWFATSIEQLQWFYRVVAQDDHGGHRQALGQYGRVFTESLRRHRTEDRAVLADAGVPVPKRRP